MSGHLVMESKKGNFLKRKLRGWEESSQVQEDLARRLVGKIAQMENLKSNSEIGPKLVQVFKNVDSTNLGFKSALL